MAELIDFDKQYMRFTAAKLAGKGEIKDDAVERILNDCMREWLDTKADWLGSKTPDGYFADMTPEELAELVRDYSQAGMEVPEPLYRRVAASPKCAPMLDDLARDASLREGTRATALRLRCDMGGTGLAELCSDMMLDTPVIREIAAQWLERAGYAAAGVLLARYDAAEDDAKDAILDVLCGYPGMDRVPELLRVRLMSDHEHRAMHAAMAAKLGDSELIEPLQTLSRLSEISYYDYKEIINAIDALGGDPGDERQFYGDPDYEALRVAGTIPEN